MTVQPMFDGHNDVLHCLWAEGDREGAAFFAGREGNLDLEKCRAGGFAGGFFAIWVAGDSSLDPDPKATLRRFQPIDVTRAKAETLEMASVLLRMARARPDAIRVCTRVADIAAARAEGAIAALMHVEGCEGIGPDLDELLVLHAAGLRSLGPVWSRSNIFGHGVPFNFPASPDTGPGLTEAGKRLVTCCNDMKVLVDLSHLNEAGFWDVAKVSTAPLVATHSNAHTVTAATRNLTDKQLGAIAASGGLVGLNFGVQFLRTDGIKNPATPPQDLIRHLDHLIGELGEGGVALGSDFDGAMMPEFLNSAAGLPLLVQAMVDAGYGKTLIRRLLWDNWLDVLGRTIG
ncbi:MAG: membrane dipeptidase [Paracoccaceae bacterium]